MTTLPEKPVNKLPNLFILGASKCGTTSLHAYLSQHPEIYMTSVKEAHFFDSDKRYAKGIDFYINTFFPDSDGFHWKGEGTPGYFHFHSKVIPRVMETYGGKEINFILVFRDPVARAWSHYLDRKRKLIEPESFEDALEMENDRLAKNPEEWVGYYSCGLYALQLKAWFEHFSRDRFCFLLSDELSENPDSALKTIF